MKIQEEIKQIQWYCDSGLPKGDPNAIAEDLSTSNVYLARAGSLEAEAEGVVYEQVGFHTESEMGRLPDAGPALLSKIVDARCHEEKETLKRAHNLKTTLTARIESLRSLLSWEKEQAKL